MPRLTNATPKYRKHRASGQAIVTLNGKDHYLGPHKSKASTDEYDRVVKEWLANGRNLVVPNASAEITVVELIAMYVQHAKAYYDESSEWTNSKLAMRPLKGLYGKLRVAEFSPLKLKAVRQKMIEADLCRNEINKRIARIKRMFKWGVENEVVEPSIFHGLQAVRGLSRGRSEARESKPVKPVPEAFVDAVATHVAPQVWAMIELQRFTGMRPGEVATMRTCDLDTSGKDWIYQPPSHKTEWRGHERHIFIGPQSQRVLKPWLRTELDAYLFQPREAASRPVDGKRLTSIKVSCMNNTTKDVGVETLLTIHGLLTMQPYIPLSEAAIREVGPAAQTLGGLYRTTGTETFVEIEAIADKARIPRATCKHQLKRLQATGWISNLGRQCTRKGYLRRTATLALTTKAKTLKAPYLRLPYWATGDCRWGRITWKARVLLAVISSRYNILRDTQEIAAYVDEDGELLVEEFEDRFDFSLSGLQKQTGLDHKSITGAKRELNRAHLIDWRGERDGKSADLIVPNINLSVVRTDFNSTNRFRLDLAR